MCPNLDWKCLPYSIVFSGLLDRNDLNSTWDHINLFAKISSYCLTTFEIKHYFVAEEGLNENLNDLIIML